MLIKGSQVGLEICKILGIDPIGVSRLTIEIPLKGLVSVKTDRFLNPAEFESIKSVLAAAVNNPPSNEPEYDHEG